MSLDALRRLTLLHGIVAWIGTLLLLTVAIMTLRSPGAQKSWFRFFAMTSTVSAIVAFASGLLLEQHYRIRIRQHLFIASKNIGWLFERKMHFSLGVCAFAIIGALALFLARNDKRFFRSVRISYGTSALLALASCVISTIVALNR